MESFIMALEWSTINLQLSESAYYLGTDPEKSYLKPYQNGLRTEWNVS